MAATTWDIDDGDAWLEHVTAAGERDTDAAWAPIFLMVATLRAQHGPGTCRTYWGSHGCMFGRGHRGPCMCDCAVPMPGEDDPASDPCGCRPGCQEGAGCEYNVGAWPHYGDDTEYYGEDAPVPVVSA